VAQYLPVERTRPAVVAFHGDAHRQVMTAFMGGDAFEELTKALGMMIDVKLVDQFAVG